MEWIAVELERAGYTTIIQSFDFRPGTDFAHQMQRAPAVTGRTIAVLSQAYFASKFGEAEWRTAFAKDPSGEQGLLIPARIEPCEPPGMLATRVYVDLVGVTETVARRRLLAAVDRNRPRPTTAAYPGERRPATHDHEVRPPFPGPATKTNGEAAHRERAGKQSGRSNGVQLIGPIPERANAFQDRREAGALRKALATCGTAVVAPPAQVLSGMFGVGKTQLAADYAWHVLRDGTVDMLLWITATDREGIVAAYSDAVTTVLGGAAAGTSEQNANRFLSWLTTTTRRWLIVLDDLTEPKHLNRLWPPHTTTGKIIVTTKFRDSVLDGDRRRLVSVGPFTPPEATRYLETALRRRSELADDVHGVAEALGRLPLALSHAYSYMISEGESCSGYLRLLATHGIPISDLVADDVAIPDDYTRTIQATWSISVDAANRMKPAGMARPLLELASVLDPNGTPEHVFTTAATRRWLSRQLGVEEVSERTAHRALRCLERLNLIAVDDRDDGADGADGVVSGDRADVVRVHALVQRVTRDQLGNREGEVLAAAASALEEVCATDDHADRRVLALLFKLAQEADDEDRLRRAFNRLLDMIDRKYDHEAMIRAWEATYALEASIEIVLPLALDCLSGKKVDSVLRSDAPSASRVESKSFITQEAASTLSSAFTAIDDWRTAQPERTIEVLRKGLRKFELRKRFIEALAVYEHPDALAAILEFAHTELDGTADRVALDAAAVALGHLGTAFGEPERDAAIAVLSRIAALDGPRRKTVRSARHALAELTGMPADPLPIDEPEIAIYLSPPSELGQYSDWADAQMYAEYVERELAPHGLSTALGEALLQAFTHRHQVVRVAVARCLGHLDDPRAYAALEAELRRPKIPTDLRKACVEAIAMHDARRAGGPTASSSTQEISQGASGGDRGRNRTAPATDSGKAR